MGEATINATHIWYLGLHALLFPVGLEVVLDVLCNRITHVLTPQPFGVSVVSVVGVVFGVSVGTGTLIARDLVHGVE